MWVKTNQYLLLILSLIVPLTAITIQSPKPVQSKPSGSSPFYSCAEDRAAYLTTCNATCMQDAGFIKQSLSTEKQRKLTAHEKEVLKNEGVVLLRNVIKNKNVLKDIERSVWQMAEIPQYDTHRGWLFNAGIKALSEDPLIGGIVASIDDLPYEKAEDLKVGVSIPWPLQPGIPDMDMPFHVDVHSRHATWTDGQVTVWLALNDCKYPLEFVRGTHKLPDHWNTYWKKCGNLTIGKNIHGMVISNPYFYDAECLRNYAGKDKLWSAHLAAGDAFVMFGSVNHRGLPGPKPRLSVSQRYNYRERQTGPLEQELEPVDVIDGVPQFQSLPSCKT